MQAMKRASRFFLLAACLLLAAAHGVSQQQQQTEYQSPGTRKMAALLRKIYDETDWKADPNKPAERATYYRELLAHGLPIDQEVTVRIELGNELLRSGDAAGAVATFEQVVKLGQDRGLRVLYRNLEIARI